MTTFRCTACPLHLEGCRTNCMPGKGAKNGIMFLGENPGPEEDRKGEPFIGPAGQILRALIYDAGLNGSAFFTNATRCRGSNVKRKPTIAELRACRKYIDREIESTAPKMIVTLGEYAAKSLLDDNLIRVGKVRGTLSKYKGVPVFHTYHPSAVQYNMTVKQYLQEDFRKIAKLFKKGEAGEDIKPTKFAYTIKSWEEIRSTVAHTVAVDIETNTLDPYEPGARIMSIAAAIGPDVAYYREVDMPVGSEQLIEVLSPLQIFHSILCHNSVFDMAWLTYAPRCEPWGYHPKHFLWDRDWQDTLICLQWKDEHYPNTGLKHLVQLHCGMPAYQTPQFVRDGFKPGWKTPENRTLLKRYNSKDAIGTWRLWKKLHPHIGEDQPLDGIKESRAYLWVCSNLKTAVKMRHCGIKIDQDRLRQLDALMSKRMRIAEQRMLSAGVDFHSTKALNNHVFHRLGLPVLEKTKKKQEPSLNAKVLEQMEPMDSTGFIKDLRTYKVSSKIQGNYCKNLQKHQGLAHPRVYVSRTEESGDGHGSDTGRITTAGFSNLPKEKKAKPDEMTVKKCLVSRFGKQGIILDLDYSQIEMRIMANESKDPRLTRAFEKGLDLHKYAAAKVRGIKMAEVDDDLRFKAKAVNFGIIYGQTASGLSKTTGMNKSEAQEFINAYLSKFAGVKTYMDGARDFAIEMKWIHSPLGRIFHLHNAEHEHSKDCRKAVNSPIQSAANDFTTEAMRCAQKFIEKGDWRACVVLSVYDSIVMDWHKEDLLKSEFLMPDILKHIFVTEPIAAMAQLGWTITVPIGFDCKQGPSLGETVAVS